MDGDVLNSVFEAAEQSAESRRNKNDYIGVDGLLYCGNCRTRKEIIIDREVAGKHIRRKVPVLCQCEAVKREKQEEEQRRKDAEDAGRRMREASLMDDKFFKATFDSFESNEYNKKNLELCRRYVAKFGKMYEKNQGLLFWGNVGTGKSYAAACIANRLMDHGVRVIMTSFVKLLENTRVPLREAETMMRLSSAKLVIFDDLGAERSTDYALEKTYNIIDSRYRSNKPMILTTNLTLDEMFAEKDLRYRRIYDRIFEVCYPVQWTGPSWRILQAKAKFTEMGKLLGE